LEIQMHRPAVAALFLLLLAACWRGDDLIGSWDCEMPIGSMTLSFHEDSSFAWRTKLWFVKAVVAGKWHHRGDQVILEIDAAPPEFPLKPGDTQIIEVLTLNQSLFVSKDGTGTTMTCTRRDGSEAPQD
jgi:hypothetical protein